MRKAHRLIIKSMRRRHLTDQPRLEPFATPSQFVSFVISDIFWSRGSHKSLSLSSRGAHILSLSLSEDGMELLFNSVLSSAIVRHVLGLVAVSSLSGDEDKDFCRRSD